MGKNGKAPHLNDPRAFRVASRGALLRAHRAPVRFLFEEGLEFVEHGFVAFAGFRTGREHVQPIVPRASHRVAVVVRLASAEVRGVGKRTVLCAEFGATHVVILGNWVLVVRVTTHSACMTPRTPVQVYVSPHTLATSCMGHRGGVSPTASARANAESTKPGGARFRRLATPKREVDFSLFSA